MSRNFLSEDEMYDAVSEGLTEEQELTDYEYSIMGRVSTGLAVLEGNFSHDVLQDVYRTGGMYGVLIERVDDVVDSDHGSETVDDIQDFLGREVDVLRTGERPESYSPVEEASFIAAEEVNNLLEGEAQEEFADRMQVLADVVIEEESKDECYEEHLESADVMFGNAAYLLDASTEYTPDEGLWRKTGRLLQITDDRVDRDRDRTDRQMHERQQRLLEEITGEHGRRIGWPVKASEKLIREVGKRSV
ncbi:hypothetical protein ACK3SF_03035 [Candidatus Nanosalina sp. VS9-1]|uniref:hypothetical protein n=1 Tax=Candidatus Nanosalina sp. VS9-1 TaxID=3388566 RepID=UPI0039E1B84A